MKINITKKEYRDLLDILSIADWVLTAHKTEPDSRVEKYEELTQKFYSLAEEMGCKDLVKFDSRLGKYYPTGKYETIGQDEEFIEEFENDSFWEELISRLAIRDMIRHVGGTDKLSQMNGEERLHMQLPLEQKYADEFDNHGLDNLVILHA
jgi:hypothetical protein